MKPFSQPPRTPFRLSDSLHHQLNMYALAASAAGVSVLTLTQPAAAKIIYNPNKIEVAQPACVFLNPARESTAPFCFVADFTAPLYSFWGDRVTVGLVTSNAGFVIAGHRSAAALKWGATVGPKDQFQNTSYGSLATSGPYFGGTSKHHRGGFQFGRPAYLGISFPIDGQKHYGWARITIHREKFSTGYYLWGVISGYAYETIPNKPILAGKTHSENDATLGRLAQGASGISAWRAGK
jgi:hypothetical protein